MHWIYFVPVMPPILLFVLVLIFFFYNESNKEQVVSPFSFCEVKTISPHRNMNKGVAMSP